MSGGLPRNGAHDRVVGAHVDRAVVDEEGVRDLAESFARVVVSVGDRLVGDVCRRHHERAAEVGEQHVLERRVGKHHAEVPGERRHRLGHGRPVATPSDHDRPLASEQELLLVCAQVDQRARLLDTSRHQRKRLLLALLTRS